LVDAIAKLENKHQEVLQLRYGENMNTQEIALGQGIIESEVDQRICEAQKNLEKAVFDALEKWSNDYVKLWLKKFYLDEIESAVKSEFSDGSKPTAEILRDFLLRWLRSTMNIYLEKKAKANLPKITLSNKG